MFRDEKVFVDMMVNILNVMVLSYVQHMHA